MSGGRPTTTAERRGKAAGTALFALAISVPTLIWAAQILTQAWAAQQGAPAADTCRHSLTMLHAGIGRAREVAAAETGGERASVGRFRDALAPVWGARAAADDACRDDPAGLRLLRELDLLRYAEERTVRRDATDVARRRRRVARLAAELAIPAKVSLEKPVHQD